jgi:hypothetical protein
VRRADIPEKGFTELQEQRIYPRGVLYRRLQRDSGLRS